MSTVNQHLSNGTFLMVPGMDVGAVKSQYNGSHYTNIFICQYRAQYNTVQYNNLLAFWAVKACKNCASVHIF